MKQSILLTAVLFSSAVLAGHHRRHHGGLLTKFKHAVNKITHHPEHKNIKEEHHATVPPPHQSVAVAPPHPHEAVPSPHPHEAVPSPHPHVAAQPSLSHLPVHPPASPHLATKEIAKKEAATKAVKPEEHLAKKEEHPHIAKETATTTTKEHGPVATPISADEEARRKAMAIAIGKKEHAYHPHPEKQEHAKPEEELAKLAAQKKLHDAAEIARQAKELREASEKEIEVQRKVLEAARRETKRLMALEQQGEMEERELRELEKMGKAQAIRIKTLEEVAHKHNGHQKHVEDVNPAVALAQITAKEHEEEERRRHEKPNAGQVAKEVLAEPRVDEKHHLVKEQQLKERERAELLKRQREEHERAELSKRQHEEHEKEKQRAVQHQLEEHLKREKEEHERLEHLKREREKQAQLEQNKAEQAKEVGIAKKQSQDFEVERRELENIKAFEKQLEERVGKEAPEMTAAQEHPAQHHAEQPKHHEHFVKLKKEHPNEDFGESFAAEIRAKHGQVFGTKQHTKQLTPSQPPHEEARSDHHRKLEGLLLKAAERLCVGQATTEADAREFSDALVEAFPDRKAAVLFVHPYRHLSTRWRPESPKLDEGSQHLLCQFHRAWEQLTRISSSPHSASNKQCPELVLNMHYHSLQSKERLPDNALLTFKEEEARPYCQCLKAEYEAKERLSKSLVTEDPKRIFHGSLSNATVLLREPYKHLPVNTALQVISLAVSDDPRHLTFVQAEKESEIIGRQRFVGIVPEENVLRLLFEQNI